MSDYKNASIPLTSLGDTIIMDDVSKDDSINPRSSISVSHVEEYSEAIIGYLQDGKDFSNVWGQVPEAVDAEEDGKYLLASGYHTVTALLNVVDKVSIAHAKKDGGDGLSEVEEVLVGLDLNFDVVLRVKNLGELSPKDAAKYHAAFSNVHGISLSTGEKSKTAYNALSVMNLTKDVSDKAFKPHVNDRKLAALLGVSKSTVHDQRKTLIRERYGIVPGAPSSDAPEDAKDPKAVLDSLDSTDAPEDAKDPKAVLDTAEDSSDAEEAKDGEDPNIERQDNDGIHDPTKDDRPKGSEGIDIPKGENVDDTAPDAKTAAKTLRAQSLKDLEAALDNVLDINADQLALSYSTVSSRTETGRENLVNKLLKNNGGNPNDFITGVNRIFSLFMTTINVIATENEKRE